MKADGVRINVAAIDSQLISYRSNNISESARNEIHGRLTPVQSRDEFRDALRDSGRTLLEKSLDVGCRRLHGIESLFQCLFKFHFPDHGPGEKSHLADAVRK